MPFDIRFAFDRSARSYDRDGRLRVKVSNISKAAVNGYAGSEIPGWRELALDPQRVYNLLRAPEELEKAADTFNGLPILTTHVPVNATAHRKDLVVGSTGSEAAFVKPYLRNSLVFWEQGAIDGVESKDQAELSCGYHYKPVMTPGEYEGVAYDGIMTNIVGNHVALVEIGRAGPDVVVGDGKPKFDIERKIVMKGKYAALAAKLKPLMAKDAALAPKQIAVLVSSAHNQDMAQAIAASMRPFIAQDADPKVTLSNARKAAVLTTLRPMLAHDAEVDTAQLDEIMDLLGKEDPAEAARLAQDADPEPKKPDVKDEPKGATDAPDMSAIMKFLQGKLSDEDFAELGEMVGAEQAADDDDEDGAMKKKDGQAMDKAIATASQAAEQRAMARFTAIRKAEREVRPIVGEIGAMDSADAIYKLALDTAGVDLEGVEPSAYPALVRMLVSQKADAPKPKTAMAQDAASVDAFQKAFPTAVIPKQGV